MSKQNGLTRLLKENQFLIIVITISLVLRILWLKVNIHYDEGNSGYVSMLWLQGILPNTPQSLPEAKGPFFYLLYLISTLSNEPLICVRMINGFLYVVSVATMFLLVKDWYGEKISFASTLLFIVFMNAPALEGQFALALNMSLPFALLSIYFCNGYLKSEKKILLLLSGVTMSLVLLIQPDQFIVFLLLPFMILTNRKGTLKQILKNSSALILGTIIPVFIVTMYYVCAGEFNGLIETGISWFTFTLPAARISPQSIPFAWSTLTLIEAWPVILLSILGGIILVTRRPKFSRFLAFWALLSLTRIIVKGTILGHNLLPLIPPASILSGLALSFVQANVKHKSKQQKWAIFTLVLLIVSFAPSVYFQAMQYPDVGMEYGFLSWPSSPTCDEVTNLSKYLKSHTTSGRLLVHGPWSHFYWLTSFRAPAEPYLDTTRIGGLQIGGTIPENEYEKLVVKVKNGEFDYILRVVWAPDDALTQSIRSRMISLRGTRIFEIEYRLIKTTRNIEVYQKHETTYEIVTQTPIPDESTFWDAGATGTGEVGVPVLFNVGDVSTKSNESLKIIVGTGDKSSPFIQHIYEEYQDWSDYDFISFQWYGQDSGKEIGIMLQTPDLENWATYSITEDWLGWKQIVFPLKKFKAVKGTYDLTRVTCIRIWFGNNTQGTWYLNQVSLIKARMTE